MSNNKTFNWLLTQISAFFLLTKNHTHHFRQTNFVVHALLKCWHVSLYFSASHRSIAVKQRLFFNRVKLLFLFQPAISPHLPDEFSSFLCRSIGFHCNTDTPSLTMAAWASETGFDDVTAFSDADMIWSIVDHHGLAKFCIRNDPSSHPGMCERSFEPCPAWQKKTKNFF